jgi:hypothetical protein
MWIMSLLILQEINFFFYAICNLILLKHKGHCLSIKDEQDTSSSVCCVRYSSALHQVTADERSISHRNSNLPCALVFLSNAPCLPSDIQSQWIFSTAAFLVHSGLRIEQCSARILSQTSLLLPRTSHRDKTVSREMNLQTHCRKDILVRNPKILTWDEAV